MKKVKNIFHKIANADPMIWGYVMLNDRLPMIWGYVMLNDRLSK